MGLYQIILNRLKQGAKSSPYLFSLYLEPLIDIVTNNGVGCHIGCKAANIFSYADNIVLLALSVTSLKTLIFSIDILKMILA